MPTSSATTPPTPRSEARPPRPPWSVEGSRRHVYPGQYTQPPGEVRTGAGGRYGVFGPYLRKWLALPRPELAATPGRLPAVPRRIARGTIPRVESDIPLPATGEAAARARLESFLRDGE